MASIQHDEPNIFCLNASGGTGKTYLINVILTAVRANQQIALGTGLSGIAATLLLNGRTLHSRCKIPINIREDSVCNISNKDANAELLRQAKILIIDEVSMGHKHIFECLDRSLQDIRNNTALFGGLTVLFAGDWRQVLPVVPHGSRAQIVNACLKRSYIWDHVQMLHLTQNMRTRSSETDDFAEYLMAIGNGTETTYPEIGPSKIKIPQDMTIASNHLNDLCNFVFDDLESNYTVPDWLSSKAIIAPTNKAVEEINDIMIKKFPGNAREYKSSDTVLQNEHQYPLEFINRLNPSGFPPHKLRLKKHCCIMLLRNFDPTNGHCNGTRYTVIALHQHVIHGAIATGPHAGNQLFIPRIPMAPSEFLYPFQMQRRQFPIKLAFAITANKSQGQTLQRIGIYLPQDMFSHGQFNVAISRVGARERIKILAKDKLTENTYTDNIVYKEIL
jgi:ATP-dependent DNA helicase PIF1